MDSADFREYGKKTIDYIINYKENTAKYPVLPHTEPGYLAEALPGNWGVRNKVGVDERGR